MTHEEGGGQFIRMSHEKMADRLVTLGKELKDLEEGSQEYEAVTQRIAELSSWLPADEISRVMDRLDHETKAKEE